jgi:hypothetical protein
MKHRSFALTLPVVFILAGALLPAASQNRPTPDRFMPAPTLIFYAVPGVGPEFWPPFFAELNKGLAQAAPDDHLPPSAPMIVAGRHGVEQNRGGFIVVHLLGRCDQPRQAWQPLPPDAPLGWVYQYKGQIQPFIFVDCARIARVLDPVTLGMSDPCRVVAMDTAISRVILHEWIHISLQTAAHTAYGIRQPRLSAQDLIGLDNLRASRQP